jgi:hypothetical protein
MCMMICMYSTTRCTCYQFNKAIMSNFSCCWYINDIRKIRVLDSCRVKQMCMYLSMFACGMLMSIYSLNSTRWGTESVMSILHVQSTSRVSWVTDEWVVLASEASWAIVRLPSTACWMAVQHEACTALQFVVMVMDGSMVCRLDGWYVVRLAQSSEWVLLYCYYIAVKLSFDLVCGLILLL